MLYVALILLLLICIGLAVYLRIYKKQIREISNQLDFISKNHSFKFIQTQIKPDEVYQLIERCNSLLREKRELHQEFIKKNDEINGTIVNLSHDIRTPLTSLDGYLQLADRAEDLNGQSHYITLAQTRIKQITKLVDELFLYTKLQNTDYQLDIDPINVVHLLSKNLFTFVDELSMKGKEPDVSLPDAPVRIEGNEGALERVFENIIRNYLIHGKDHLSINYENKEDQFVIHFTNLVDREQLINFEKIFIRFYKEDPSRTSHSSGLGLSIVQSLMEKMNGSVLASLDDDRFRISLVFQKSIRGTTDEATEHPGY